MSDFDPDWCVHPGETLQELMEESGTSVKDMATYSRLQPQQIRGIIDGRVEIDEHIAHRLYVGTGVPAKIWINLERYFRKGLAKGKTWTKPQKS